VSEVAYDRFQRLLRGEVTQVHVSVSIGDTNASSDRPDGIYAITTEDWRRICGGIAKERTEMNNRFAFETDGPVTSENVAARVDEMGMANRWFRLSAAVADWLNRTQPILVIDGHIG